MPGSDAALAEGNTLGKGPMLFHVPQVSVCVGIGRGGANVVHAMSVQPLCMPHTGW